MKRMSDFSLGVILLVSSVAYCIFAGGAGGRVDITPLIFTVPMALVFIAGDIKRIKRKENRTMYAIEVRNVRGHYEAYVGGKFICSGDTRSECYDAAEEFYSGDAA